MTSLPFMPLAVEAYITDTSHLDDGEQGRYISLLLRMWVSPNQRIPNDDNWIAKRFHRTDDDVKNLWRPIIKEFLKCDGNWIYSKRLQEEYQKAVKRSQKQSDRAKSRWNKEKSKTHGIATPALQDVTPRHVQGHMCDEEDGIADSDNPLNEKSLGDSRGNAPTLTPTLTPIDSESHTDSESPKKDSENDNTICPAAPDEPEKPLEDFDDFWKCWRLTGAKRGSKPRSKQLYEKITRSRKRSHQELCADVERLQRFYETNGTEVSKMLHPATWLYQERWNDELVGDTLNGDSHGRQGSKSSRAGITHRLDQYRAAPLDDGGGGRTISGDYVVHDEGEPAPGDPRTTDRGLFHGDDDQNAVPANRTGRQASASNGGLVSDAGWFPEGEVSPGDQPHVSGRIGRRR